MVQSSAASVDTWMDERTADRRPVFDRFRAACRSELPGWEERMEWGMPGYGPPGEVNVVSFNDQKRHIAFYPGPAAMERFRDALGSIDCGKGCVRYRRSDQIDFDLVRSMLRDTRERADFPR